MRPRSPQHHLESSGVDGRLAAIPDAFLDELLDLLAEAVLEDLQRFPDLDAADPRGGPTVTRASAGDRT